MAQGKQAKGAVKEKAPAGKSKKATTAPKGAKPAAVKAKKPASSKSASAKAVPAAKGAAKKPAAKAGTGKAAAPAQRPAKKPAAKAGAGKEKKPAARPKGRTTARLPHLDNKTLDQIVAKLHEMREESRQVVNQHVQADLQHREEGGDVGDDMDQASNERDREFSLLIHQRHLRRLKQVEDAFERIEDQSYGLCEGTEEPINPKRLLIMPLARFSLEYQQQQEKMLGRSPDDTMGGSDDAMITDE